MVVKKMDISSITDFRPLVNWHVPSNVRYLVSIVHTFGKKDDKDYLFFNYELPGVDILDYYTWAVNVKNSINNAC